MEIERQWLMDKSVLERPDWFGKEVTYDGYYKMKNFWNRTRLNK